MKYIDKSALVAEIEKYISNYKGILNKVDKSSYNWLDSAMSLESKIDILKHILSFLDTLEMKEVKEWNLENEFFNWYNEEKNRDYNASILYEKYSIISKKLAKHFFELGLSVNNPITATDRGIVDEIIFALNALGKEKMISYDKEIEWLRNKLKKGE